MQIKQKIVIVGGGAGGLELACQLAIKLGPKQVVLIDNRLSHIWKPSLHEVAAGTLDIHAEGLSYQMLAHDCGFDFVYGPMTGIDVVNKTITVGPVNNDHHVELLPERIVSYHDVVIAVGSISNYFNVQGASENTIALNAVDDAERFRVKMMQLLTITNTRKVVAGKTGINIVIIGGGATGVELAAELSEARRVFSDYGIHDLDQKTSICITILEGSPRILAPLPERVATTALKLLKYRSVNVVTDCRVVDISTTHVTDITGIRYPSDITVWAAGIKAPDFLGTLGMPTERSGALLVGKNMQVVGFPHVYALGDCAACHMPDGKLVPPRAQAAHQQASYLMHQFIRLGKGKPLSAIPYKYNDYGSLVSIGQNTSVGSLMGSLAGRMFIDGWFARMMYVSLHLMHHIAVLGIVRTGILAIARFLIKRTTPLVKLH